jgi:hypothetical protein
MPVVVESQENILNEPEILTEVEQCLHAMYGWDFTRAKQIQTTLSAKLPDHPAPDFLRGLILYWEQFPLLPDDPATDDFILSMDRVIEKAAVMLKRDPDNLEGIFFDMHARAFTSMFWADNGKPAKVIPDLNPMYRQTLRGMERKDEFNEFYFSSGLYHYYITAYVEAHPIYKPIAVLFKKGSREQGLKELEYAIRNTTYIRTEAILFMSLLQLNYEHNLDRASDYAAMLYNAYPDNLYYLAHYTIILLHQGNYSVGNILINRLDAMDDPFAKMLTPVFQGFVYENLHGKDHEAVSLYHQGIESSEKFGDFAGIYRAIAYAGLSRISERKGDDREARKLERHSASESSYRFILDYAGSR